MVLLLTHSQKVPTQVSVLSPLTLTATIVASRLLTSCDRYPLRETKRGGSSDPPFLCLYNLLGRTYPFYGWVTISSTLNEMTKLFVLPLMLARVHHWRYFCRRKPRMFHDNPGGRPEPSIVQRDAAVHSNVHVHECLNFLILVLQCLGVDFLILVLQCLEVDFVDIQRVFGPPFFMSKYRKG